jgi:hypothetical protein
MACTRVDQPEPWGVRSRPGGNGDMASSRMYRALATRSGAGSAVHRLDRTQEQLEGRLDRFAATRTGST